MKDRPVSISYYIVGLLTAFLAVSCQRDYQKEDSPLVKEAAAVLEASERGYVEAYNDSGNSLEGFFARPSWKEQWKEWFRRKEDITSLQYIQFSSLLYEATGMPPNAEDRLRLRRLQDSLRASGYLRACQKAEEKVQASRNLKFRYILYNQAIEQEDANSRQYINEFVSMKNMHAGLGGYADFYAYKSDAYQRTTQGMTDFKIQLLLSLRPLMEELHTWLRYKLAGKYNQAPPDELPIYWLSSWSGYHWELESPLPEGLSLPIDTLSDRQLWEHQQQYFDSCGFSRIDDADLRFGSDLFGDGALFKVLRSPQSSPKILLDSMAVGMRGWQAMAKANIEEQAYRASRNLDVPLLLQKPACPALVPAYQEAMKQFMLERLLAIKMNGLDSASKQKLEREALLYEALEYIPKLVYYAGVMGEFEQSLYVGELPSSSYSGRWTVLMRQYLGVQVDNKMPLSVYQDGFLKGGAMDTTMSLAMKYQFQEQLEVSPEVSKQFNRIFYMGGIMQWDEIFEELAIASPNGEAMVRHFEPLMLWLKEQNEGRVTTLPDWNLSQ